MEKSRACSIFGAGNADNCKKSHVFQNDLLIEASGGAFFAFVYGHVGKELNAEGVAVPEGVKGCHERFLISRKAGKFLPS